VGAHARDYALGARSAGVPVREFADKSEVAAALRAELAPGVVVLVKASRGAALEQVLAGLDKES
jgi:UDP-N-acetylmuramyl pentapeptide synthase